MRVAAFPESAFVGWLANYRDAVAAHSEAPDAFHWAAAAAAIGLRLGRRVFTHYAFPLYPNFFFVLLGPTGIARKTSTLRVVRDAVPDPDLVVLHGISTAEGLVAQLAKQPDTRLLIMEPELRGFLKKAHANGNGALIPKLCDLFDAHDKVDLPTRNNPLTAERPLVSFLSAATTESLEDAIEDADVYGGFLNRVVPIAGEVKPPQPWPSRPAQQLLDALAVDLDRIVENYSQVTELAIVDPAARERWEIFYHDFYQCQASAPELLAALTYRLHTHVQKFALLFGALRGGRDINAEDLTRALEVAAYVNLVIEDILRPLGLTPASRLDTKIEHLLSEKPSTRRELHQRLSGRVKARDLKQAIDTLIDLERIIALDGSLLAWVDAPYFRRGTGTSEGDGSAQCAAGDGSGKC